MGGKPHNNRTPATNKYVATSIAAIPRSCRSVDRASSTKTSTTPVDICQLQGAACDTDLGMCACSAGTHWHV